MEKELVILGFSVTNELNLARLKEAWGHQAQQLDGKKFLGRGISETKEILSKDLGGEIVLVDFYKKPVEILASLQVLTPMGLYYDPLSKSLFTGSDHWIYKISRGTISRWMDNKLFNCIHGISGATDGKILITSTGVDALLEIDLCSGALSYDWLATENGYHLQPGGKSRFIDRAVDYQGVEFSTLEHTTHVNSSLQFSHREILATFFHQGQLVKINKDNGHVEVVLSSLVNPHNIRKGKSGFIVSDTNGKRVIKLNENLQVCGEISGDYNWIQDALQLDDGRFVIADANNGRVVLTSESGNILNELDFGNKNKRIGSLCKVKIDEAENIFFPILCQ